MALKFVLKPFLIYAQNIYKMVNIRNQRLEEKKLQTATSEKKIVLATKASKIPVVRKFRQVQNLTTQF